MVLSYECEFVLVLSFDALYSCLVKVQSIVTPDNTSFEYEAIKYC